MYQTFNSIDIILLLGISQGLFLAITLVLVPKNNKAANKILSYFLLIATTMLFGRIALFRLQVEWVYRLALFIDAIIFAAGPLFYLYQKRLLFRSQKEFRLRWFHFVPALVHVAYNLYLLRYSISEYIQFYQEGKLSVIFFLVEIGGLLSMSFYLLKCFRIQNAYRKEKESFVSYESSVLQFLKIITIVLSVLVLLWWVSFIITQIRGKFIISYTVLWILIPVLIYVIGFFSLRQPELFRIPKNIPKAKLPDRLNNQQIEKLSKRLLFYMEEEHLYLSPELTLKSLASKIDASTNDLSWLLNNSFGKTFYEYINDYRIDEFLNRTDQGEHRNITLLALAYDVGFNSKTTFNKAFKKRLGVTPSVYLKTQSVA